MSEGKIKVAVIGGGCASMAAVWELSKPEHKGRYEITVYQEGWRLGGKGASGRNLDKNKRIEEHGLHVWLGFYDNAFRMMRECYKDLATKAEEAKKPARPPERAQHDEPAKPILKSHPDAEVLGSFGDWRDAWIPENDVALFSLAEDGHFERWDAHMPPRPGTPGDDDPPPRGEAFSLFHYMARSFELLRALMLDTKVDEFGMLPDPKPTESAGLGGQIAYVARLAAFASGAALSEGLGVLATLLGSAPDLPWLRRLLPAAEAVCSGLRQWLEDNWVADDKRRFVWEIADLTLATIVGLIRDGVMFDERGLDAIDHKSCREWLAENGASMRALQSPFLRGLFDLSMGYLAGDPNRPELSAGQGLRGTLRTFFGYRGAFMWRMRAGMGDVVFAPLYVALKARGVTFEFFHRLTDVRVSDAGGLHVSELIFDVQAKTKGDDPYEPLVPLYEEGRVPRGKDQRFCWPSRPNDTQLVTGDALREHDFESHWDRYREGERRLKVVDDFDFVVLGVGLGAVPHVCKDILARDERWRDMTENVKTVASQAVQLWLTRDLQTLGWESPAAIVGAFAKPFDTWCDMKHVVPEEAWARPPRTCVYFCAALADPPNEPADHDTGYPGRRKDEVEAAAKAFLQGPVETLWPKAHNRNGFRWDLLAGASGASGPTRLEAQYFRANVNPTDRYVIHTPGSYRYRISPLDRTYDNLTIAGDWTDSGFHSGCVEGAVMSGLLAAHALSGSPRLEDIIAYDHP